MNNWNVLHICFCAFWFQLPKECEFTSLQITDKTCSSRIDIEKLEKCKLCTRKTFGHNSISDKNCIDGGVYKRFFQCSNEDNDYDVSCDLEKVSTVYDNYVSISVPSPQNNQTWSCYFDLTNRGKDNEYRARFYVNQTSGCSNSTNFDIDKPQWNTFWYRVKIHSEARTGIKMV